MYFLFFLSFVLFLILLFLATQFFNILFRGYAPFFSTHPEILKRALAEIKLKSDEQVLELGCGDAGFLRTLEEKFPQAKYTGIEYSLLPYLITKFQLALKKSKINIKKQNVFKTNLEDTDLIYCFLNNSMMKRLEKKFQTECKKGTKIISLHFPLPGIKEKKVINVEEDMLYFYEI